MTGEKIVIIEDDEDILEVLKLSMKSAGYEVLEAQTYIDGEALIRQATPDVVLLDVNLPDGNGFNLAKKMRKESDAILIFVTVHHQIDEKLLGFEVGADDYITKPFIPKELIARVQAHLNRKKIAAKQPVIQLNNLEIRPNEKMVYKNKEIVNLFTKERLLLFYLIEHANKVLTIEQLLNYAWGYDGVVDAKTLSVHISTLRKKIEDNPAKPQYIQTVRGFGYMFSGDI